MIDTKTVKENFPFESYRPKQEESLEAIAKGLDKKDYIIYEGPTGTGKSPINIALCRSFPSAYYITPQKTLQQQLIDDFGVEDGVVQIKGRQNYECIADSQYNCSNAMCQKSKSFQCPVRGQCKYWRKKLKGKMADITIANFSYLLAEGMIPRVGDNEKLLDFKRDLLVVDEGHNLKDFAYSFVDLSFGFWNLPPDTKIPYLDDFKDVLNFSKNLIGKYELWKNSFSEPYSDDEIKKLEKIEKNIWKIKNFHEEIEEGKDWVYKVESGKNKKLVLKPIDISDFLKRKLWSRADKVIVSSATIPDPIKFVKQVGLEPEDVATLKVPMTFPKENRPIHYEPVGKLTRKEEEKNFPKALKKIQEITEKYPDRRGLIHCHSYKRLKNVYKTFKYNDRFIFHNRKNRDERFERWLNDGDNTIFVSAGFSEGIDLYDDRCRFQILLKVPYPSLGDIRVKYKVNELDDWKFYNIETIKTVVQSYGRAVRSPEDHATFYILDKSFEELMKRWKYYFPDWFMEAIENDGRGS